MISRRVAGVSFAVALMAFSAASASAAENDIRVVGAYGLQFLPTYVAIDQHLIEKHAKALGIVDPKVTFNWVSNGGAINDALISGTSDVGQVPGPALVLFWNRTRGAQAIRGMLAGSEIPPLLITVDPRIKTIDDYTDKDRIAMATVKISSYAIMMQMAAAQHYGWDQRNKFDPLSVQLGFAETMAALLSGGTEIKSTVIVPPYDAELLESGKAHQVLSLDDVLGGHGTLNVFATTEQFHSQNSRGYAAVKAGLIEAIQFINEHPHAAAEIYLKREPSKHNTDWIVNMLDNKKLVNFTPDPHRFGKLAAFLHKTGAINDEPASWRDLFFDQAAGLDGN
ncbi:MAG: ABC transporter substrate-binding protein [Xanthobacteraceae bacterium]